MVEGGLVGVEAIIVDRTAAHCSKKGGKKAFPGGPLVKILPVSAGDMGSTPGPGRFHMPPGSEAHAS